MHSVAKQQLILKNSSELESQSSFHLSPKWEEKVVLFIMWSDTYLLLHQEYLLILCIDLFVMNQLCRRGEGICLFKWTGISKWKCALCHCEHCHTFLTGGFVIKSSNGSSGRTVVRFSCKIPIFFSLSHPDGLEEIETVSTLIINWLHMIRSLFNWCIFSITYMNTASFSTTKADVVNWKSNNLCTIYL